MVHKKEKVHLQCGYEDQCKKKNCLKCPMRLALTSTKLTLAEAIAIEDFAVVDLDAWAAYNYGKSQRNLTQDIMRKLMKRIIWEKKGRLWRKAKAIFRHW